MPANNAVLVVTERKNQGDAGVPCPIAGVPTAEGVLVLGVADGLGSLISASGEGTVSFGKCENAGTIQSQNKGTMAFGYAENKGIIATEEKGSLSFGYADGFSGEEPFIIQSQIAGNGVGAQAFGIAQDGGIVGANGDASLAFGRAYGTNSTVTTTGSGAKASGAADNSSSISANGVGSESSGYALNENSAISAQGNGSKALGLAMAGGSIQAIGNGSLARGQAYSGTIVSSAKGSEAFGCAYIAGSQILASGEGAKAFGFASNGYKIKSTNYASFAFGVAENESIEANAQGSFAGGFPLAGKVQANGVASIAFGDANDTQSRLGVTFGLGNVNSSYASLMLGKYGKTTGATPTSWVDTDPLLVLGNGTGVGTENNAFEVSKDGKVTETAAKVNTAIKVVSGSVSGNARSDRTVIFNTNASSGSYSLPTGEDGLEIFVLDGTNNANFNNITVSASEPFQHGSCVDTINVDGGSRHYQFKNGFWYILSRH